MHAFGSFACAFLDIVRYVKESGFTESRKWRSRKRCLFLGATICELTVSLVSARTGAGLAYLAAAAAANAYA